MEPVFTKSAKFQEFASTAIGSAIIWILLKVYTVFGMGFCFAPLVLLSFHRWWKVYKSVWFFGFFLWWAWPAYKPVVRNLLGGGGPKKSETKSQ